MLRYLRSPAVAMWVVCLGLALFSWYVWVGVAVAQAPAGPVTAVASSKPKVTDYWGAINGTVSAAAVIFGGIVGYQKFLSERRQFARADLSLQADLFSYHGRDFVRATVGAKAVGTRELVLVPTETAHGQLGSFVAVYPYRANEAADPTIAPLVAVPVFVAQNDVQPGESIQEGVMLELGERSADVLAYRVELGIAAVDPRRQLEFNWRATDFVPAGLRLAGEPVRPEGDAGAPPPNAPPANAPPTARQHPALSPAAPEAAAGRWSRWRQRRKGIAQTEQSEQSEQSEAGSATPVVP